eukprot:2744242-Alexandrium_andersonii.AAC.1
MSSAAPVPPEAAGIAAPEGCRAVAASTTAWAAAGIGVAGSTGASACPAPVPSEAVCIAVPEEWCVMAASAAA